MAGKLDSGIGGDVGGDVTLLHTSQLDQLINMARESSLWYLLFGLACCGIEMMQTGGPRADLMRFGAIPRASPRQADFMIVAGTLTYKMAERAKLLYDQMSEPKYVISMGSCSNCGGLFQPAYSVCKGVDKVIPVDVYVPGCPPRPEALTEGLIRLQEIVRKERWSEKRRPAPGGKAEVA
jgi:NADH-quinone oxidoreductase subunit B